MMYFSLGGATVWPFAGISVFPEKGSALFWHNTFTNQVPDMFTQHTACAVLVGNKWIGNKWVGYNAQWNQTKCALLPYGFPPIHPYSLSAKLEAEGPIQGTIENYIQKKM